jgi:hypothetical protein
VYASNNFKKRGGGWINEGMNQLFIDFKKAYESVRRKVL